MFSRPAVTIHGLEQARTVLLEARPVLLLSAPGAASHAGCGWWQALIERARAEFPQADLIDVLDCADAPGRAMAALRVGLRTLVLDAACPAFPAVRAAAATLGATVLASRPESLDLAQPGAERKLTQWLRRDIAPTLR
jgi:hypothetical protein